MTLSKLSHGKPIESLPHKYVTIVGGRIAVNNPAVVQTVRFSDRRGALSADPSFGQFVVRKLPKS